jgi:VWFA-related protein
MTIHARLAAFLLLPWFSSALILAQQNTPPSPPPTNPTNGGIHLDVVVTPKSGAPVVTGLQQQDFTILDNKSQQTITSFRAVSSGQEPVEVVLLIDDVNTTYTNIAYERGQIDKFLRANGGHLAHPTALAILSDTGIKTQDSFSTDGNAVSASLDQQTVSLRDITRSAGFYGATDRLQISLNGLEQLATHEATHAGRKLILWISPGWPFLSGPRTEIDPKEQRQIFTDIVDISTRLRQARITLYSVNPLGAGESTLRTFYYESFLKGVTKPSQVSIGNLGLQVIAVQSGGLALNSSNDVAAMLQQCVADADAWYEITFEPAVAEQPDEYHHLEIRVDKPGLVARTRQGYYAQAH